MLEVLSWMFIAVVAITIAAALIYIGGFLASMFVAVFTSIDDAVTHHHHGHSVA